MNEHTYIQVNMYLVAEVSWSETRKHCHAAAGLPHVPENMETWKMREKVKCPGRLIQHSLIYAKNELLR